MAYCWRLNKLGGLIQRSTGPFAGGTLARQPSIHKCQTPVIPSFWHIPKWKEKNDLQEGDHWFCSACGAEWYFAYQYLSDD